MQSREGLTIDVCARALRKSALNPWLAILVWVYFHLAWRGTFYSKQTRAYEVCRPVITLCAVIGAALSVNDWITKWSANNWIANSRSDWNWDKEIVLITGGSGGIGASIAQQLLHRNSNTKIIIVDYIPLSWKPPLETKVSYYKCDLSDPNAIRELGPRIIKEIGNPTVLVNNAGLSRGSTVMEGSYREVDLTIRTNLVAPFLLLKEFLPCMVKMNHGHIINVSSMSSKIPPACVADYAATKAGINALHEALQLELKYNHKAPKIRLSLGIFSFIQTPLFKGETRQSRFLFPLLHVDSVGTAFADVLYGGYGKTIYMPGAMRYVAILAGAPEWVMRAVREGTQALGVDYRGRQIIDQRTGYLK